MAKGASAVDLVSEIRSSERARFPVTRGRRENAKIKRGRFTVEQIIGILPDVEAGATNREVWRPDHNEHRPHSSLGNLTPSEFASQGQATLAAEARKVAWTPDQRRGHVKNAFSRTFEPDQSPGGGTGTIGLIDELIAKGEPNEIRDHVAEVLRHELVQVRNLRLWNVDNVVTTEIHIGALVP